MTETRSLLGLIGAKIQRSLSPAMHEAAGDAVGLDVRYHLIDSDILGFAAADLPQILDGVRRLGFTGVNVTHPFKEAVVPLLDGLEGAARRVGAVNTVVVRGGRLIGHNTDYSGFVSAWRQVFGERRAGRTALIGAGGVGRAMAHGLAGLGLDVLRIFDVEPGRAEALAAGLAASYGGLRVEAASSAAAALEGADGAVNATPIGTYAYPGQPVADEALAGLSWVADAIYTPIETRFVAAARRAGAAALPGRELAIGQAVDAFGLFFNRAAPADVMRATFEREVKRREPDAVMTA